jgi:hypothetical protein
VHVPGNPYAANRKAVIQGIRPGTAEVIAFEAGFSEIRSWQVATVFVCTTPTIALDRHSSKVAVGSDVTLTATPSGTGGLDVNWFEGDHYLGTGTTFTFVNLPPVSTASRRASRMSAALPAAKQRSRSSRRGIALPDVDF